MRKFHNDLINTLVKGILEDDLKITCLFESIAPSKAIP
ncbi:hypothetical protein HHE02_10320 [Helicobacter heilmannii]|uniref:Uncharacterized protein n=1 Tax=Helicobacter heilmannii TaxID=35817 RepID=A0A0K2XQ16_HELHE|nr:hypothetical protein BN341_16500 [Helicobacter heilmannii ASB1.4]CRF47737.1 hypothetical protein HHE02_10320 [Helicobacter heilmannii]CRF49246.1 hypothetical protein HHE03_08450 [Helicobacter heilmannii]CRF50828.1 hypothetical protein HHE06_06810 [Helicobacter heilmannii]CRI35221.1 hypothetical protein HHE01_02190 [Helicobacter heilmannii]